MTNIDRRRFIRSAGAAGTAVLLAGCSAERTGNGNGDDGNGNGDDGGNGGDDGNGNGSDDGTANGDGDDEPTTLTVGTYESFLDAPSTSPGEWLKEAFEDEYDVELVWETPSNGLNNYIERSNAGSTIEADLYLGVTTDDLIRVDENADESLFAAAGEIEGAADIREQLVFDPDNRAVPFETGYISLVYDENETEAPETFEGLLADDHRGELLAQSPESQTGRAFLLHTIHTIGEEEYLDYWAELQDNDVRVLGSWSDSYAAYTEGEAPMVVSYSTDQVFANMEDADLSKHQIRFLNDQAYANPEGMARFADSEAIDLAESFMSFVLRPDVQGEIAERNVVFPATTTAELDPEYDEFAHEPPEPVTFTYDELQGNLSDWVDAWNRQFAGN
ncbi:thiamine ABC transporter substrate-binding protein [Halalkalirubrum salinum]|uniref:thiamine ABC transporter substrate-binding protein n=1 Tax=Halalkalirubrum salinum TaxID=2563889 RepID=UPI0010FB140F|nr:thiamine ABC transporter substrate-binding protein [Halalkalirubrum salinum]